MSRLFTPRDADGTRLSMQISDEDSAKMKGRDWRAVVTDLNTGTRWAATSADCGADCFCDAMVIRIDE